MASDLPVPQRRLRTFLAERYSAGTSQAAARRESAAVRVATVELTNEGQPIRLVGSLLVPSDDTLFALFSATSADDVAAVGERANQPYDRISVGVPVTRSSIRRAIDEPLE